MSNQDRTPYNKISHKKTYYMSHEPDGTYQWIAHVVGMVSRVMENGYYEIMTSGGTINRMFRADELSAYSGQFVISSISNDRISLRAAAIYFNNNKRNSKVGRKKKTASVSCQCVTNHCKDNRCKCSRAGTNCNSHCHVTSRLNCQNRDN